jgi:peroxiredoxin
MTCACTVRTFALTAVAGFALGVLAMAAGAGDKNPGQKEGANAPKPAQSPDGTGVKKDKGDPGKKSAELKVGDAAPDFALPDTSNATVKLADFKDKVVILEWFNPECPFVVKQYAKTTVMADSKKAAQDMGAVWIAINSGAPGKQGAGASLSAKYKEDWKIANPILIDEKGEVGRAYGARTTPHMFIIKEGKIVYAGAIDNDRSADKAGDKNFVIQALGEIKAGKPVSEATTRPYGCSVKY